MTNIRLADLKQFNIMNKNRPMSERSKHYLGLCKNDGCYMMRREYSAYCEECSKKYKKLQ